jgi:hypothetical protein
VLHQFVGRPHQVTSQVWASSRPAEDLVQHRRRSGHGEIIVVLAAPWNHVDVADFVVAQGVSLMPLSCRDLAANVVYFLKDTGSRHGNRRACRLDAADVVHADHPAGTRLVAWAVRVRSAPTRFT